MVRIAAGDYRPFYRPKTGEPPLQVREFWLDLGPVTRGDFERFVSANPAWQKGKVDALFAEASYLTDWHGDATPSQVRPAEPVSFVSWFAAKQYCAWHGKRLPTVVEWEHANAVAQAKVAVGPGLLPTSWEWALDFNSIPVTSGNEEESGGAGSLFCGAGARAQDAADYAAFLRYAFRSSLKANYTLKNLGFRCAKDRAP